MPVKEKIISTFFWGFVLWLIGYVVGFILFFLVPKAYIGWVLTPFATLFTIWVLFARIKRPEFMCYIGLGVVWTIMALVLDFLFIVKMLQTGMTYYKPDVFLYYALTFILPVTVGYWKFTYKSQKAKLF